LVATLFDGKSQNGLDTIACAFGMSTGLPALVLAQQFKSRCLVTEEGDDVDTYNRLRSISHGLTLTLRLKLRSKKNANMEQWLSPT